MILKRYNNGTFEPIIINISKQTVEDDGSVECSTNQYSNIEDSIDSKISKDGDLLKGTLQFEEKSSLVGVKKVDTDIFSDSRIEFKKDTGNNNPGFFRVKNILKDTEDDSNSQDNGSFNLICDSEPTEDSKNLLTSGAIFTALKALSARIAALEE